MADYIIKKHASFQFAFEGGGKTYELPAAQSLTFEDADFFFAIRNKSVREQCEGCKEFVIRYNPELKDKDIGDMEYLYLLRAYIESQGKDLGEP